MIGALLSQQGQYYSGTYLEKKTDTQGSKCRYELLIYPKKSYGQVINNLISSQGTITIKTNDRLNFKVNSYFIAKDKKCYIISQIEQMEQEINPQTAFWLAINPNTDIVLSLIETDNVWEIG